MSTDAATHLIVYVADEAGWDAWANIAQLMRVFTGAERTKLGYNEKDSEVIEVFAD